MKRIEAKDLKSIGLLKHYRVIRKWACRTYGLSDADLELLIYLESIGKFTRNDFKTGTLAYSWKSDRWSKLVREGWIVVWRRRNNTTQKYNIYTVSMQMSLLSTRIYKMLLGQEDIPESKKRNVLLKRSTYSEKVLCLAVEDMRKDKTRWQKDE
jgi:hypothetical protein